MRRVVHAVRQVQKPMVLAAMLALLTACQAPVRETDTRGQAFRAESAASQGRHRQAAQIYLDLARQESGSQVDHWRLLAAQQWLNDHDLAAAIAALDAVSGPLDRDDYDLWAILAARLALGQDKPAEALARLDEAPTPSPAQAARFHALRGQVLVAMGRYEQAVQAYAEEQNWLDNGAEVLASQQRVLDTLTAAAREGALPTGPASDPLIQGWFDLARVNAGSASDGPALLHGLRNWSLAHPEHPANSGVVAALGARYRGASRYPRQVALLLPLSGREQPFGEAVRDGFLAAYMESPGKDLLPVVRVYDTREGGAPARYREAIADGADMVIGPLLKPEVTELMGHAGGEVPLLALNQAGSPGFRPAGFYQFALDPEDEARQVARRAVADGHYRAVALVPANGWGNRLLQGFEEELVRNGGEVLSAGSYDPAEKDYSTTITRALHLDQSKERFRRLADVLGTTPEFEPRRREDLEFIFLAAQPEQGRLLRPQLKFHYAADVPVYSPSAIYQDDSMANKDLDGLQFADMPWSLHRAGELDSLRPKVARSLARQQQTQPRLLAMGVDAFRLMPWLYNGQPVEAMEGATGRLDVSADGIVRRELEWARFSNGRARVLPPPAPGTEDNLP